MRAELNGRPRRVVRGALYVACMAGTWALYIALVVGAWALVITIGSAVADLFTRAAP